MLCEQTHTHTQVNEHAPSLSQKHTHACVHARAHTQITGFQDKQQILLSALQQSRAGWDCVSEVRGDNSKSGCQRQQQDPTLQPFQHFDTWSNQG